MGLKSNFMNLGMKNSLVFYDQKFRFSKLAEILVVVKHLKLSFYYLSKNSNNFSMGLKNRYCKFMDEKFLGNLRPKTKVHEIG